MAVCEMSTDCMFFRQPVETRMNAGFGDFSLACSPDLSTKFVGFAGG